VRIGDVDHIVETAGLLPIFVALDDAGVGSLADRLEIGERQLRRLFRRHVGATPISVAQTRRVLLAKQLIHQSNLSMIQVALASGFGSVRRFNETFQQLYRRPPGELRRRTITTSAAPEISLLLPYRPPYQWAAMIGFLEARAIAGVEVVEANTYSRVIELGGEFGDAAGSIRVIHEPRHSGLRVIVRFPKLNALPIIIARIRRMFDSRREGDQGLAGQERPQSLPTGALAGGLYQQADEDPVRWVMPQSGQGCVTITAAVKVAWATSSWAAVRRGVVPYAGRISKSAAIFRA
jgi:AraC family transcriptional regulator, regulatory protein of adaptative response / DNA-3-methyladenine glycosylase II